MTKKGAQPGNNNATKGKVWSDAVRKALLSGKKLDILAKKLVDMACEGDIQAIKEVGDRLEGKPMQSTQLSTDPDQPVITKVIQEIVYPTDKSSA